MKYNNDEKNEVKSGGVMLDPLFPFMHTNVVLALRKMGAKPASEKSRQIDEKLIAWAELIVIVADNVNPEIFSGKKVVVWKVSDTDQSDVPGIAKREKIIEKKVKDLIKRLK